MTPVLHTQVHRVQGHAHTRKPPGDSPQVVLEAEYTNTGAMRLYENLGFVRDKRLPKYYLNGSDAYRLKLWLK